MNKRGSIALIALLVVVVVLVAIGIWYYETGTKNIFSATSGLSGNSSSSISAVSLGTIENTYQSFETTGSSTYWTSQTINFSLPFLNSSSEISLSVPNIFTVSGSPENGLISVAQDGNSLILPFIQINMDAYPFSKEVSSEEKALSIQGIYFTGVTTTFEGYPAYAISVMNQGWDRQFTVFQIDNNIFTISKFYLSDSRLPAKGLSDQDITLVETENKIIDEVISSFALGGSPRTSTMATSSTSMPTPTTKDLLPVPTLYDRYNWRVTTSSYPSAIDIYPPNPETRFNGTLSGQSYTTTNTDPGVQMWQQSIKNCSADCSFYGGDQAFLNYYDQALQADGYVSQSLNFDKNLNLTSSGSPAYEVSPFAADGPNGTARGYVAYQDGSMRVVIVESNTSVNKIFISDVISLKVLIP